MRYASDMDRSYRICPSTVPVKTLSQLTMPWVVIRVAFQHYGTTKSVILLLTYWKRFVPTPALNLACSHWMEKLSDWEPPILKRMLVLTYEQTVSGLRHKGHFLTLGYSTQAPLLTVKRNFLLCTGCMRTPRRENMVPGFVKWSGELSHLWCFPQRLEWQVRVPSSISVWLTGWLRSERPTTLSWWDGWGAGSPSHSWDLPSGLCGDHGAPSMLSLLLTSKWCLERASAANFSHQPLTSHHLVILTFRMISFFYLYHRQCSSHYLTDVVSQGSGTFNHALSAWVRLAWSHPLAFAQSSSTWPSDW